MKNLIQTGEMMDYTAGANIASGAVVLIGVRVGIATTDIANGAKGSLAMDGVYSVAKLSTDVVAQCVLLYWDNANSRMTVTAGGNTLAGYAIEAAGNGVATVKIRINR